LVEERRQPRCLGRTTARHHKLDLGTASHSFAPVLTPNPTDTDTSSNRKSITSNSFDLALAPNQCTSAAIATSLQQPLKNPRSYLTAVKLRPQPSTFPLQRTHQLRRFQQTSLHCFLRFQLTPAAECRSFCTNFSSWPGTLCSSTHLSASSLPCICISCLRHTQGSSRAARGSRLHSELVFGRRRCG
jgi:hypothetical protein